MDRIKESFDSLPIAVCFFDANGVLRLVNHKMLAVMDHLRSDGVQTLTEMESALKDPPEDVTCLSLRLGIYRFPDNKSLRFAREDIFTKAGTEYTQITATDVTELLRRQAELKEENAKLAEVNEQLRKLFEQMPEIIREEETLEMKLRVHDDIVHSILTARRTLLRQPEIADIQASAQIWEQAISVLYRSNQMREETNPLDAAISKSREMGVNVLLNRNPETVCENIPVLPILPQNRTLIALAIIECSTNCVRHADGTKLYMSFNRRPGFEEIVLTNNGAPPVKEILEGGGLSMLRHHVEESGGSMKIESLPDFKLILNLPREEEIKQ